uniref:F-box associated beta-propeller type 3 domain-containing protein n=1 Tax=Chenopodium quinoa TaxID=63459 RepID=A0A803MDW3_CHEQI
MNHPLKPHKGLQLIGSCNGVVCISTISKSEVFLYNPLTNSHRKLPSNPIPVPDLTKMLLGFGYDSKNNDYKVLRIIQGRGLLGNTKNEAQVYSFNDNSWKCIKGIPYYLDYCCYYHGVLVNEALHYVVSLERRSRCLSIARFDLWSESFSLIERPNYDDNYKVQAEAMKYFLPIEDATTGMSFMPQMSLLCVDLTDKEKKKARERANYALDDSLGNLTFKINRLALYKTDTEDKSLKSWLFKISCLACCLLLLLEESLYRMLTD